ncbi:MAG TPA: PH domain-containing protein [Rhizomicrobium sp.]|nr:PH domain-containing protein [Rhizomicrobium sp.]
MSYIQKSMGGGETIVVYARFPKIYFVGAWLALLIPFLLFMAMIVQGEAQADPYTIGAGVLFLLGLITFIRMMVRQWSTEIGVTSHRFVEKYGLLSMRTNEIALPNIEGVRMHQSVLGRVFNYGTVRIEGTGVDSVTTPAIADPVGFVRAIQTAKELMVRR